jgi:hypothetical protein
MTITDTPPSGVTVLFFQLSITGATLTPQMGSGVSLLTSTHPIPVNVSQLQTEMDFLGNTNVPAGTYTGLSATFANPQLTIFNGTGAAIGSCANNTVCQLNPTASSLTLNFSSSPFPIILSANSPLAFQLDVNLNTVMQPDLSVNLGVTNGVTISQITPPAAGTPIPRMGSLLGTVQTPVGTNNQFTLQPWDGRTFTITVNSSTTYTYPSGVCAADNSTCVVAQQVVKVLVSLQSDGTLLASEVDYVQPATQQSVEGNIVALSTSGAIPSWTSSRRKRFLALRPTCFLWGITSESPCRAPVLLMRSIPAASRFRPD